MGNETEKIEARLAILDSDLKARNQTAETILWGVAHVFRPPREMLEDIRRADIVTLELPPGAIAHRKKKTDREMLAFWDAVLGELESSNKRFWAVDSNKILRNTRKAIIRRLERSTDTRINIFLKDVKDLPSRLEGWVSPDQVQEIIKTVENDFIAFVTKAKVPPEAKTDESEQDDLETTVQLFIAKPFHASVKSVCRHVRMRMEKRLPEEQFYNEVATTFALDYVTVLLMSYIDKTQSYEILRRLQNFCKNTEAKRILHVHVGGYIHNKNLTTLLGSAPHERYKISERKDTRFPIDGLSSFEFFGNIPLRTRIGLVHAEKNEVTLDADSANAVFDSIIFAHKDMDRLITCLKIEIMNEIYSNGKGRSEHCRIVREMLISHLSSKIPQENLAEIEKRCVPAEYFFGIDQSGFYKMTRRTEGNDPLEVFLAYLKEKGFKPEAETLQYIKKGRESRCI